MMAAINKPRVWNQIFVIGSVQFYRWDEPLTEWHKYISVEEYERRYVLPLKKIISDNFPKPVYQYTVKGQYVMTHKSLGSAAKATYTSRTSMWNYLIKSEKIEFRGYIFSLEKLYDHE